MIINVYCPIYDKHFCLNAGSDLKVEDFKVLCSTESGISASAVKLLYNNEAMTDNKRTLSSYKVEDNDMIVLEVATTPPVTSTQASSPVPPINFSGVQVPGRTTAPRPSVGSRGGGGAPTIPQIDFSQIRVPGLPSSSSAPRNSNPFGNSLADHVAFRQMLLDNPSNMEVVRKIYPPVIDAMLSGNEELYVAEFFKFGELLKKQAPLAMANPMDVEVQKRIAEEIERKNIDENMTMAMEQNPESFAQVVMLWINLKVNGHHVKAFVDSGAQMTIMSAECAQRCNIMRLVDKRWEGVAKGVGTQKIIGRIHLAQIQIEDVFLQCSFSVLENQPMDVLLGLDMLRRHLCVINLRENTLSIGTNNTKTRFLSEAELPSYGRLTDPNAPPSASAPSDGSKETQITFCRREQPTSSKNASKRAQENSCTEQPTTSKVKKDRDNKEEPPSKLRRTDTTSSLSSA